MRKSTALHQIFKPALFRASVRFTILTFSTSLGCSSWRPMPSANMTSDSADAFVGKRIRFYTGDDVQTITVRQVELPYVVGTEKGASRGIGRGSKVMEQPSVRIDLREVDRIEIYDPETKKTLLVVSLVLVGTFAVLVGLFLATWSLGWE